MNRLIICEKDIAARRIAAILSQGKARRGTINGIPYYQFEKTTVVGLKGHIKKLDFPKEYISWDATQPKNLIGVKPLKKIGEQRIASALKELAYKSNEIIIATDYDREGELIGTEVLDLIPKNVNIKRARFSAITPNEILSAFSILQEPDYNLAASAEARQYIDLIWGATLTRFISIASRQLGKDFLSVGRVQSPTLALVVDREKQIQQFTPRPFWTITITLEKDGLTFIGEYPEKLWDEAHTDIIFDKIKRAKKAKVTKFEKFDKQNPPPPPFDTTTFLKESAALGFSTSQAMKIAEDLYMNGLISYPRTDNTVYPALPFKSILNKLKTIYPEEITEVMAMYRGRPIAGKKMSKDHPPIHPVEIGRLQGAHAKLYDLIARRFMATLSKNAILEIKKAEFSVAKEQFIANGLIIKEPNWRKVYPTKLSERRIPDLEIGETITISQRQKKKETTKPPKRYTQGSLIVEMEKKGLGTKSTRHEIISKLIGRQYISGRQLIPTPSAFAVMHALEENAPIITKPDMTASLEDEMNQIAEGDKSMEEVMSDSKRILYHAFSILEKKQETIGNSIRTAIAEQNHFGTCSLCGKELVLRKSLKGKRFIGCSNYPHCTNSYPLPQKGMVAFAGEHCGKCGAPVVISSYKGKKYKRCANMKCG